MDKLYSVHEAADRLGVSFWTVYRLARCGQLASVRVGRRRLFADRDLENLIRTSREQDTTPRRSSESATES
jgi:excisionase family DNA binding protein